jgi:phage terminase large subunit-like protein
MTGEEILHLPFDELEKLLDTLTPQQQEELLSETQHLRSSNESRFDVYVPTPPAKLFHQSNANVRCFVGANRSSKTLGNMVDDIAILLNRPPNSCKDWWNPNAFYGRKADGRICGTSAEQLETKIIPMFRMFIPPEEMVSFNKEFKYGKLKNGSTFEFKSYEQEPSKMAGARLDFVHHDEEPPYEIWKENAKRCVGGGRMCLSMTPENGITWVYDNLFLNSMDRYMSVSKDVKNDFCRDREMVHHHNPDGGDIFLVHSTMYDNQYISDKEIKAMFDRLFTEEERRVCILGEFRSRSGLVYSEFSYDIHTIEPDKFEINPDFPHFMMIDPGLRYPFAILVACIDNFNRVIVTDEYWVGPAIDIVADAIKDAINKEIKTKDGMKKRRFMFRKIDPNASAPADLRHPEVSILSTLNRPPYMFRIAPAGKKKENGITLVKNALHYTKESQPNLYVYRTLKHLIHELQHYEWRKDGQKAVDKDDHFVESLYRLFLEPAFRYTEPDKYVENPYNDKGYDWASDV